MPADGRTVSVLFDGRRLTTARELRGLMKVQLARSVHVTPAAIGQFENGVTRPGQAMVGRLALALQVPAGFFVGDRVGHRVEEADAHFRTLRSVSKVQRLRELARIGLLAEFVDWLEGRVRLPDVSLAEQGDADAIEAVAASIRRHWALGDGPIVSMVRLLEASGVVVTRLTGETSAVDAYSAWIGSRPFVVLNDNKGDPYRSRFDAAHELGHLSLHRGVTGPSRTIEQEADRFASELLLPRTPMLQELPRRLDWPAWFVLKRRWNVSVAALLRRARDLGVLSHDTATRAWMQLGRYGWRTEEPSMGLEPERPEVLSRALGLVLESEPEAEHDLGARLRLGVGDLAMVTGIPTDQRPEVIIEPTDA